MCCICGKCVALRNSPGTHTFRNDNLFRPRGIGLEKTRHCVACNRIGWQRLKARAGNLIRRRVTSCSDGGVRVLYIHKLCYAQLTNVTLENALSKCDCPSRMVNLYLNAETSIVYSAQVGRCPVKHIHTKANQIYRLLLAFHIRVSCPFYDFTEPIQ